MSNWIQLTSGGGFDFETRKLFGPFYLAEDLAQPLALALRFGGRGHTHWSVAQHSVSVAKYLHKFCGSPAVIMAGLLHDAHEAIIGDIPTPVGIEVGAVGLEALKRDVQTAIETKLGVHPAALYSRNVWAIKAADLAALHVERLLFLAKSDREWSYTPPAQHFTDVMLLAMEETAIMSSKYGTEGAFLHTYFETLDEMNGECE